MRFCEKNKQSERVKINLVVKFVAMAHNMCRYKLLGGLQCLKKVNSVLARADKITDKIPRA